MDDIFYYYIFSQVFLDAIHHFQRGKCPTVSHGNKTENYSLIRKDAVEILYEKALVEVQKGALLKTSINPLSKTTVDALDTVCRAGTFYNYV